MTPPARSSDAFDGRLPPPTFAAIETTMFCNLSCHFCIQFQNGTTVTGPHMEPETFATVSDKLFPHLQRFQPSVSGEPLMSKGLDLVLAKAERMGVRAEYYTNATLLKPKVIERILATAGKINISFDGATKETFEALRAGANFEDVVANIRALMEAVRKLPEDHRPPVGFACTLMDKNIGELAELVNLAAELGLDSVAAGHVVPGTVEVQKQSVYHDLAHAARCIDAAVERARTLRMPFSVQPLDQLIATLAVTNDLASPTFRNPSEQDGVVDALSGVALNQDLIRPWPSSPPKGVEASVVSPRPVADAVEPAADQPDSIWTCQFLWEKLYVDHDGGAVPCCIPGTPELGSLVTQPLDEVWNGEVERAMRIGMAQKKPADCCRGCQHIRQVDDPAEIALLLGGRSLPEEPVALPPDLRVVTGLPKSYPETAEPHAEPPTLRWDPAKDAERYIVQLSMDGFRNIAFSTDWHKITLEATQFRIPDWAWAIAEESKTVHWHCLAVLPRERRLVSLGAVCRVPSVAGEPSNGA